MSYFYFIEVSLEVNDTSAFAVILLTLISSHTAYKLTFY